MEVFRNFALEVHSIIDLIVLIVDKTFDAEFLGMQHALKATVGSGVGPLHEAETRHQLRPMLGVGALPL